MNETLEKYKEIVNPGVLYELFQLSQVLKKIKILHINSTKSGGGVAEILRAMIPLLNSLGIDSSWEVIDGNPAFFECTKQFHNGLQGHKHITPNPQLIQAYEKTNIENAERLRSSIEAADIVFIHDPQPAALIQSFPNRQNKWIWRCHIDASSPNRTIWRYLRQYVTKYDASIFSLADFAQSLPHPMYLIAPSINPLDEKNTELDANEIAATFSRFNLDPERPIILQVSRFDQFKDPLGVIQTYKLVKKYKKGLQLVLAGGGASDDPEGEMMLEQVKNAAKNDSDIHVLFLPSDAHRTINALQRMADVVLQKSLKEGFGLTVTESLWKKKPVIGGNCGGIRLQVVNYQTGFLVNTPEGAADRIRLLLQTPQMIKEMGEKGHQFVKDQFLITRHIHDYLTLIIDLLNPSQKGRVEIHREDAQ